MTGPVPAAGKTRSDAAMDPVVNPHIPCLEENGALPALSSTAAAAVILVAAFTIWQSVEAVRSMAS